MDKPLFSKYCHALEYQHLFKSHDDMNFYSAKKGDNNYIMVNDYDRENYDVWSETPIILLEDDRLLCKRNEKYGVVNAEGWTIIPFVYDRFDNREEAEKNRYSVLLGNKWGVIDSSGRELFRIKYSNPIPILKFPRRVSTVSNDVIICRGGILVEDADTHRQGLVSLNGQEVIPTIYSKIEQSGNWDYVFVNWGAIEEPEPYSTWNGVWGCYNWQGKEVIPVKYHAIHYIDNYFIAGDDEYSYGYEDYGTYDLYNLQGTMIIGGFNNCQIGTNYFIFKFGITIKSHWEKSYWNDFEYDERLVEELNCDKMCSIIVDKELKSLIPRHLIEQTLQEIEYEIDFLCNNLPAGEGLLIGECPKLCKGKRYSETDKIIKGISVHSASFINDIVVMYSSNKKIAMNDDSIVRLKGIIYCNELKVIPPTYIDVKSIINSELLFILNKNGLVGIRNISKELLKPQFNIITNPHNNIAIGFKITYIEEEEIYQCQCSLLKFNEDSIHQEDIVKMTGSQLYELLYCEFSNWKTFELSEEHKILITQYWEHIFSKNDTFWYSYCNDFKYLWKDEHYEEIRESMFNDSTDSYNWEYYNDGLDMDQQDERFWNF